MKTIALKSKQLFCTILLLGSIPFQVSLANESNADLWQALKQGGKVVLMRHAPVIQSEQAGNPLIRDVSCQQERNLSDEGKKRAHILGAKFKAHRIEIEAVLNSPYCRTHDTALIAFGQTNAIQQLSLISSLSPEAAERQTEQLSRKIGNFQGKGNLILISHRPNINALSFESLKHLDFLVLQPNGQGEFEELGVIRFEP